MRDAVYLDHNATTPLADAAKAAMLGAMDGVGNASSVHGFGRARQALLEGAREAVAALAGVTPARVIFTSGGSEANNMALRGVGAGTVLMSAVEHASVLDARDDAVRIAVDGDGVIDLGALDACLADCVGPVLVSVMAANNETGVIQPLGRVTEIVRRHGARLHVDAVQAAGKIDLAPIVEVADALSLSAHKMGGPAGIGALIVADGVAIRPLIRGGGQERRRRAGTENVIAAAGFGAAADAARTGPGEIAALAEVRDGIETALTADAVIYGKDARRLANTACIGMPGVAAETQVMAFDLAGIAVSAGSACSSGKVEPSHVLTAMGAAGAAAEAVRVSLGRGQTAADGRRFVDAWRALRARTREAAA